MASDPIPANSPSSRRLLGARSAIAPTTGRMKTWRKTDVVIIAGNHALSRIGIPSRWTKPSASAESSAIVVRYGPRKTVTTVVENADAAQS